MKRMETGKFGYGHTECENLSNIQQRCPTGNYGQESRL